MPKSLSFKVCDFFSPSRRGSRHEGPVCSYCCSKYQSPQDGLVQKVGLEFHFFTHFIQEYSTCEPLPLVGGQSSVGLTIRVENGMGKINDVRDVSVNLKSLGNSYWIVSFVTCGLFKEYCGWEGSWHLNHQHFVDHQIFFNQISAVSLVIFTFI